MSRKRKKGKTVSKNTVNKKSRYIKKVIREVVNKRDFFECAWCGIKLTEKHHIIEFSDGGENVAENLILLCPVCHEEVHKSNSPIDREELILRKSTHLKGDRIAGNMPFDAPTNEVRVGTFAIINHNPLLAFNKEPVLALSKHGDGFVVDCRLFNKKGDLIFWMSKNRFWANSDFAVSLNNKKLQISNNKTPNNYITIEQIKHYFNIEFINYSRGRVVKFGDNGVEIKSEDNKFTPPIFMKIGGEGTLNVNGKGAINV